jgi:hypothetical protein
MFSYCSRMDNADNKFTRNDKGLCQLISSVISSFERMFVYRTHLESWSSWYNWTRIRDGRKIKRSGEQLDCQILHNIVELRKELMWSSNLETPTKMIMFLYAWPVWSTVQQNYSWLTFIKVDVWTYRGKKWSWAQPWHKTFICDLLMSRSVLVVSHHFTVWPTFCTFLYFCLSAMKMRKSRRSLKRNESADDLTRSSKKNKITYLTRSSTKNKIIRNEGETTELLISGLLALPLFCSCFLQLYLNTHCCVVSCFFN